jgi:hypothetical protein
MNSLDNVSRRDFLCESLKVGAAGVAMPLLVSGLAAEESTSKERWQIGCYTRPWDQHDYRVALDAISEAGFKHLGLMTTNSKTHLVISVDTTPDEAEQVNQEVKKRGLRVAWVRRGEPVASPLVRFSSEMASDALVGDWCDPPPADSRTSG